MKSIHTLALTALAAAMAAGTAFAQQPTTPPTTQSQAEQTQQTQQRPQTQMGTRDHDKDRASYGDKPSYQELDVRGDGRVTRADLSAHPRLLERFDDIDSDGDGTISRSEYDAWMSDKDRKHKKDHGDRRSDY